jgi:uncharacterized membrane protein YeaQ/YmgE (transglycosylase-associated protein family)
MSILGASILGAALAAMFSGFLIGAAARFALPGPDPMPFWLTVLIGLSGAATGTLIASAIFGAKHTFDSSGRAFFTLLLEVGIAVALVAVYRRFVQKRPIVGPGAHSFPTRGFGIGKMRERLQRLGIDPNRIGRGGGQPPPAKDASAEDVADQLEKLRDLHARGTITDEEYERARERLRRY